MRSILFTGHMIDQPGRGKPRFPAHKEKNVQQAIEEKITATLLTHGNELTGIAGGACGGDILFHELLLSKKISTEIYLPLPVNEFIKESVSFAGVNWEKRFQHLLDKIPFHIIHTSDEKNIWEETNKIMFVKATVNAKAMTLIALWDLNAGDGKGGTQHMVEMAQKINAEVEIIDINKL